MYFRCVSWEQKREYARMFYVFVTGFSPGLVIFLENSKKMYSYKGKSMTEKQ